jgi:hypothetical protein
MKLGLDFLEIWGVVNKVLKKIFGHKNVSAKEG